MLKEKRRKRIIIIISVVLLLIAGTFTGIHFYKKYHKPTPKELFSQIKENKISTVKNLAYSIDDDEIVITGFKEKKAAFTVLNIPDTIEGYPVTAIASKAFQGDTTLETVICGGNIKIIGNSAFEDCGKLKTVYFGAKTKQIKDNAFKGCINLSSATLNNKLEIIQNEAFANTAIKSIYIPENVMAIEQAFPEKITVLAKAGSYAERWAKANELTFKEVK